MKELVIREIAESSQNLNELDRDPLNYGIGFIYPSEELINEAREKAKIYKGICIAIVYEMGEYVLAEPCDSGMSKRVIFFNK